MHNIKLTCINLERRISKTMVVRGLLVLLVCLVPVSAEDQCPKSCFCSKGLTSVNCEGKHFESVPVDLPTSVVKLYLGHNVITSLPTGTFRSLPRLELLRLDHNKLTDIQPNAFDRLLSLTELDLRDNNLVTLGNNSLSGMPRLKTVYLVTNSINKINQNAFNGSTSVSYLSLQANLLGSIPNLGYMPSLKRLVMEGNSITNATFPPSFTTSRKLEYIGLSNNNIQSLENVTFAALKNVTLSSLYLSRNAIKRVESGTFIPFTKISSLKLGTNPLNGSSLKNAIESLRGKDMVSLDISGIKLNGVLLKDTFKLLKNMSITTLNMRSNVIQKLPDGIFEGLNGLLHLDISSCGIQETSKMAFNGLDKLTVLSLSKNRLMTVPVNLPSSLTNLYLDDNQITIIEDEVFSNLVFLQELMIRYNKVLTLKQNSFNGLMHLNKLSLYNNYVNTLPGKVFEPLVRLSSLDLAKNNIQSIPESPDRFSSQGSLVYLSLADNQCFSFQLDLLKSMTSLQYLHLERNKLGPLIAKDSGGVMFRGLEKLKELHMNDNNVFTLHESIFQDLGSLVTLNVSHNKIAGWGTDLFKSSPTLHTLDMSSNLVATIKKENVHDLNELSNFNLSGNPFACNCDLRWFRDWMNKTSTVFTNNASYTCNGPKEWEGKPLFSFDRSKINCTFFTWYAVVISCAVGIIFALIVGFFIYKRRWHIKLYWYKLRRSRRLKKRLGAADGRGMYGAIGNEDRMFDAYISYAEEDEVWVREHLLPDIDDGHLGDHQYGGQFRLYYDDRDSEPGNTIIGNMFENMVVSRKVLVILSRHYLHNNMNLFELDLANQQMYKDCLEEVIIIHIDQGLPDKLPKHLQAALKRYKVMEWTNEDQAIQLFKQSLRDRLAVSVRAAEIDAV